MDQRAQLVSFPLNIGMDNVSIDEAVQPSGNRPRLVLSRNTRLTKVPGMVSKAPGVTTLASGGAGPFGGLVSIGGRDSTLYALRSLGRNRRVAGDAIGALDGLVHSAAQSSYYPAQVTAAGVLPGSDGTRWNASCAYIASLDTTYYVTIQAIGGYPSVCLTAVSGDGTIVVKSTILVTFATATFFGTGQHYASITAHGTTLVLWYGEGAAASLSAAIVTVDPTNLEVSLGIPVSVYAPSGGIRGPRQIQVANDPADASNAYIAIQHNATPANVAVLRVNVPALTVATSISLAAGTFDWVGITYTQGVGLMVATSVTGGQTNVIELNTTTLATVWFHSNTLDDGVPSMGFQTYSSVVYRVLAVSRIEAGFQSTYVTWYDPTGVVFGTVTTIKQQTMVGHVVTLRHANGTYDALITAQVCYTPAAAGSPQDAYDPNSDGFVPDPSIEVWRIMPTETPAGATVLAPYCVARLGVDLAIRYPGMLNAGATLTYIASSSSCIDVGSQLLISYLQENIVDGNIADGYVVRYALLDFGAVQPRFGITAEGIAVVAGALTTCWDGDETTELSPLRQPKITGVPTGGGAGVPLPAGTYQIVVIISWKDSSGQIHRSAPSNGLSLTNGGAAVDPILTVYLPDSYRNLLSQVGYQVVIYVSETDGLVPYATRKWQAVVGAGSVLYTTEKVAVTELLVGEPGAFFPAVYTDSSETQELPAFCPNASLDATIIADRLWVLDAERTFRRWFSKPKVPDVFFEMSPDLFIDLPASSGDGVATSELNGSPLFLTSRGIWTVAGDGPDALLQGPFFSAPQQVSDVACTQRLSVVKTPVGVMFVSNNRFARFAGQLQETPEIDATLYGNVVGTALFRKQQECAFFLAEGYVYVYNWQVDSWTLWDQTVTGLDSLTGCTQRFDGKVVLTGLSAGVGTLNLLDPDTVNVSAQIVLETGWVLLGTPQDHFTFDNVAMHAKRTSAHALAVDISVDYDGTVVTRSYSAANVLSAVTDNTISKCYDLLPEVPLKKGRAIKLVLTESGSVGEAFQPINVTLEVIKQAGRLSQSIRNSARK